MQHEVLVSVSGCSESTEVNKVSFTGSVATGRRIGLCAMKNLVPATLELGGKSPVVVFSDAVETEEDLEKTVEWIMVCLLVILHYCKQSSWLCEVYMSLQDPCMGDCLSHGRVPFKTACCHAYLQPEECLSAQHWFLLPRPQEQSNCHKITERWPPREQE